MRLTFLVMFLGTSVTAMCQPAGHAPRTAERAADISHGAKPSTDCKPAAPNLFSLGSAIPKGERWPSPTRKWSLYDAQPDSANSFASPFSDTHTQTILKDTIASSFSNPDMQFCTLVAQNGETSFNRMSFPQWSDVEGEPIPTQWPNAKFEAIPTIWPNLKIVPMISPGSAMTLDTSQK